MNDSDQILAIADFDGKLKRRDNEILEYQRIDTKNSVFQRIKFPDGSIRPCYITDIPNYLTSYDAIRPVIQKLKNEKNYSSNPSDYPTWMFSSELLKALDIQLWDNGSPLKAPFDVAWLILKATPRQLCEALLKSIGKWKD